MFAAALRTRPSQWRPLVTASAPGCAHRTLEVAVARGSVTVGLSRKDPVSVYYERFGTPQPSARRLLFVTGWAGSCENWRFQTEFFSRLGFEVLIYENRGSGFSSSPTGNYRMSDMAKDARDLVEHFGWDKFHVVGVSMGGMIAQEIALLLPDRIASLCLASTHAGLGLPPSEHIPRLAGIFARVMLGLTQVKEHVPRLLYSQNWLMRSAPTNSGCINNLEYMLKFHSGRLETRPPQNLRAAMAQLWGICRHYVSQDRLIALGARLRATSIPAMVIHGTEDCLVHVRNALHLARHTGARLVLFDGRGHAMNHEDTHTFNSLLLRHFYTAICKEPEVASVLSGWKHLRALFQSSASRVSDRLHQIFSPERPASVAIDPESSAFIERDLTPSSFSNLSPASSLNTSANSAITTSSATNMLKSNSSKGVSFDMSTLACHTYPIATTDASGHDIDPLGPTTIEIIPPLRSDVPNVDLEAIPLSPPDAIPVSDRPSHL